jgi:hypothetical protein
MSVSPQTATERSSASEQYQNDAFTHSFTICFTMCFMYFQLVHTETATPLCFTICLFISPDTDHSGKMDAPMTLVSPCLFFACLSLAKMDFPALSRHLTQTAEREGQFFLEGASVREVGSEAVDIHAGLTSLSGRTWRSFFVL